MRMSVNGDLNVLTLPTNEFRVSHLLGGSAFKFTNLAMLPNKCVWMESPLLGGILIKSSIHLDLERASSLFSQSYCPNICRLEREYSVCSQSYSPNNCRLERASSLFSQSYSPNNYLWKENLHFVANHTVRTTVVWKEHLHFVANHTVRIPIWAGN